MRPRRRRTTHTGRALDTLVRPGTVMPWNCSRTRVHSPGAEISPATGSPSASLGRPLVTSITTSTRELRLHRGLCAVGALAGRVPCPYPAPRVPICSFAQFETTHSLNPMGNFTLGAASPPPFCGDMDGDGDKECVAGDSVGCIWWFENVGNSTAPRFESFAPPNGTVTNASNPFHAFCDGTYLSPFCGDFDFDGDLDCLMGRCRLAVNIKNI